MPDGDPHDPDARQRRKDEQDELRNRQQQNNQPAAIPVEPADPAPPANSRRLAERLITQYGGPETRIECVDTIDLGPLGKHCKEYKTTFLQHTYSLDMWGPNDIDPSQADRIAESCFAAAVSGAVVGLVYTPLDAFGKLAGAAAAAEVTLRACIETQNLLGKFASSDFAVRLSTRTFWP